MSDLIILFLSSFLAATVFPAQSEIVLVGLNVLGNHDALLLLIIATSGNVLGSLVNWVLGFYLMQFKDKRWFPMTMVQINKYSKIYQKWGIWSLLLAWVPFIGDPLTVIAGMFKVNIWLFLLLVTIGKFGRYLALILVI